MGNRNDGAKDLPELSETRHIRSYGEDGLAQHGNADAKKLAAVYKQLSKDGLTQPELEKLHNLDESLKGASFECLSNHVTLVIQEEKGMETDFVVLGSDVPMKSNQAKAKPVKSR